MKRISASESIRTLHSGLPEILKAVSVRSDQDYCVIKPLFINNYLSPPVVVFKIRSLPTAYPVFVSRKKIEFSQHCNGQEISGS